jgi:hypothetical protein
LSAHFARADATQLPLPDKAVDLVFTSPPYADARTYGINAQRNAHEWVEWMLVVVAEMCRVSRGLVLVNCAGVTRDWCYWPCCEGLLWEWFRRGGACWRPAFWHRVGIPGSGGKQWLRADVEYVLAFTGERGPIPWSDNTANGHKPAFGVGGAMSYRDSDGVRFNATSRRARSGDREDLGREYPSHRRYQTEGLTANPGNLIRTSGGHLGCGLAHENEAPFPEKLAEWFIRGWCPPQGAVLDCFSGSGTTAAVAQRLGRVGVGFDLRQSQCLLGNRRVQGNQFDMFTGERGAA